MSETTPEPQLDAIESFPHCDPNVLHSPSWGCVYCNTHPDWQQLRQVWGINFTGEHDPKKEPCPSLRFRSEERVHAWAGNRPTAEDGSKLLPVPTHPRKSIFDRMRENPFKPDE